MGEPITASKLPIARHCRWWAREDVSFPKRERGSAASNGVRMHDAFAEYVENRVFPPLSPSQRLLADHMRKFWGERAAASGWEAEVAYALHAKERKARRLGKFINRRYDELGRVDPEIGLSVDYQWIEGPGTPLVGDWKTGFGAHVEDPDQNLQLLAGGASVAHASGLEKGCILEISHVTESGVFPRRFIATPLALHAALHEIATIQGNVVGAAAHAGEHCRFCPALGACPETKRALGDVRPDSRVEWTTAHVSDENDALLVEEIAHVKKAVEQIEDALKERARAKPIYLHNGKLYKAIVAHRSSLKKERVEELLGPRYAECVQVIEYESFRQVKA